MLSLDPRRAALKLLIVVLMLSGAASAKAQTVIAASPDITIDLGAAGGVADESVVVDSQLGFVLPVDLGPLPGESEIAAFALNENGQPLIAFETTTLLPDGLVARPGDVIRYQGGASYKTVFSASAVGLSETVAVDAVSGSEDLLILSFDTTVLLGGAFVAADEDLVLWDGSSFDSVFKGSSAGMGSALDVDAAHFLGGVTFLVSFDTSGEVGGVAFDDEDVLRWDDVGWTMEFDASAANSAWSAGDLDALAVPEPGGIGMLVLGCGLLVGLRRRA